MIEYKNLYFSELRLPGEVHYTKEQSANLEEFILPPRSSEIRLEQYLNRLSDLLAAPQYDEDDALDPELAKGNPLNVFVLNVSNKILVERIAQGIFKSEQLRLIEQGRGLDTALINFNEHREQYLALVAEKQAAQKESLKPWIEYLKTNDAHYPTWFRYLTIRELRNIGSAKPETASFNKRTASTVASFPELNPEALAFTYQGLSGILDVSSYQISPDSKALLLERLSKKHFSGLYGFALKLISNPQNKISTEGEWLVYPQGSDANQLESALKGKGTGWCTAAGHAHMQLATGDFYVYFTKDVNGNYSQPRIAIRMVQGKVEEIRGIGPNQELEPDMIEIAEEKGRALPGFDTFKHATEDMKFMTQIYKKCFRILPTGKRAPLETILTENEIKFILEYERPIKSFGYTRDPRIQEVKQFHLKEIPPGFVFRNKADFSGCENLKQIAPDTIFEEWANFSGCSALKVIPSGVMFGKAVSFEQCTKLTTVESDIYFGSDVRFNGCTALTSLPQGMAISGWADFRDCKSLKIIPAGCKFNSGANFSGCSKLQKIEKDVSFHKRTILTNCHVLTEILEGSSIDGELILTRGFALTINHVGVKITKNISYE